jgi:hypothetical protein
MVNLLMLARLTQPKGTGVSTNDMTKLTSYLYCFRLDLPAFVVLKRALNHVGIPMPPNMQKTSLMPIAIVLHKVTSKVIHQLVL